MPKTQFAPQTMEALVIAMTGKSDSARVVAATAISIGRLAGHPKLFARTKVSYFISDRPLSAEEWKAKYCTGN